MKRAIVLLAISVISYVMGNKNKHRLRVFNNKLNVHRLKNQKLNFLQKN